MLTLKVEVEGKTFRDLCLALEEAMNKVEREFTSGMDSNESGRYSFEIDGKEEFEEPYVEESDW